MPRHRGRGVEQRSLAAREDFDCALLAPAFFDLNESDRLRVIEAFSRRATPRAPIKKTIEQLSVATAELGPFDISSVGVRGVRPCFGLGA